MNMITKKVKLTDVCTQVFAGGDVPKDRYSETKTETYPIPIYANAEKDNGLYGYTDTARVEEECVTVAARGTIGFTAIRKEPFLPVVRLITVIPNQEKIKLGYLYYALRHLKPKSSGTSIPQLTVPDIKKYSFNIAPIEQQERIITILDKTENLINLKKQELELLDDLIKSRFVEMFGDPRKNPFKWLKAPMGNFMVTLTDFSANGSYEYLDSNVVMYDDPNYALMVRTTDLEKQNFKNDVKYIDENAYNILEKSKIFGNEIIMNKIGSAGKVYLMPCLNRPVSLGRNAFMFRYDNSINVIFMYNLLTSEYGTKEIMQHVRGAVTKTITKDAARSVKVIVPPIDLQNQFATFVQQVDKLKVEVLKSLDETQRLFNSLLQKYFD